MSYSPIDDLIGIIGSTPGTALAFLGVASVPWLGAALLRLWLGPHLLYRSAFRAAVLASAMAVGILLAQGPPAGLSPAGIWYLLFLYSFIPAWLLISLGLLLTETLIKHWRARHR